MTDGHCDYCGLPAVCMGADLAVPRLRCPRCCREKPQIGGKHGPDNYIETHLDAEGLTLYRQP